MRAPDLLRAAHDAVRGGTPVVLRGARGTGRSWWLRTLAERLRASGSTTSELAGSDGVAAAAGAPLVPFAPLLLDDVPVLEVYRTLPARLAADPSACVLIDDADLLDTASHVLVGHLARVGCPVVLTVTDLATLAPSVRDGISGGAWLALDLPLATPDELLTVAAARAGGELAAGSAADLLARAAGRPAVAVALVEAALPAARLTTAGVELGWPDPVPTAVRRWGVDPTDLSAEARRAAQVVAVAGGLPADAAVLIPGVDDLLDQGVLDERDGVVAFACRLDRDLVAGHLTPAVARRRWAEAADAADTVGSAGADWSAQATLWRARSGIIPTADDALVAARSPRLTSAERLELLAAARDDDPETWLLRGSLASAGPVPADALHPFQRCRELLAADAPAADDLLLRLGREVGLLHAVRLGDPGTAVTHAKELLDLVRDPTTLALLETDLVKWRLMAGETGVVAPARQAEPVDPAAEVDAAAVVGASVIGAMIASMDGTREAALAEVEAGHAALARTTLGPPHAAELLDLSRFLALVFDGDLAAAAELATTRRDAAALAADPELGMWEYAAAELALHAGELSLAARLAGRAVRHLAWQDFTGLRATADALVLAVAARRGQAVAPVPEETAADIKVELHLARAAAEVDRVSGTQRLVRAAHRAFEEMQGNLGLLALDDAWMILRTESLAEEIRSHSPRGDVGRLLAERVTVFHRGAAHELEAVAQRLDDTGLHGRAADAWDQAARRHREDGRPEAAARAHGTAAVVRSEHGTGAWPEQAVVLSPREAEIARLAAQRVRSREIGDRLGLSVRTVDNHLARVYRKLGVAGRDELAALLGEGERPAHPTPTDPPESPGRAAGRGVSAP